MKRAKKSSKSFGQGLVSDPKSGVKGEKFPTDANATRAHHQQAVEGLSKK